MKIIFAEDQKLVREGLMPFLRELDPNVQILEAEGGEQALELAKQHTDVDLVLLDYLMPPGLDGIAAVRAFRDGFPDLPLVVMSGIDELEDIEEVLDAGALGFVEKRNTTSQIMLSALRLVLSGGVYIPPSLLQRQAGLSGEKSTRPSATAKSPGTGTRGSNDQDHAGGLTDRQVQVLEQLAQGKPNKLIARALGLQEGTVKMHLATIFRVLNVNNRVEAVIAGQKFLSQRKNS